MTPNKLPTQQDLHENAITTIIETSPFPIVAMTSNGTILQANSLAESLYGYDQSHLANVPIETLFLNIQDPIHHQTSVSPFIYLWRGSLGEKRELTGVRNDGTQFPVEVWLFPRTVGGDLFLFSTFIDLTEQQWAKSEFAQLSRHHQHLLNSAGEGIYGLNLNGQLTFINPTAAKMIGWEPEDLVGKPQHSAFNHSSADAHCEATDTCQIFGAFRDGMIHHVDDEVFWRKDGSCFPVEYTSTPMDNEKGETIGAVITFRDITQRKQIEEADNTLRVMKDDFIATASHELKTPIASLQGFLKLLLNGKVKDPAVQLDFLTRANQDVDRLLVLIHDLLDTSKLEAGLSHFELEDISLNSLIQETCESFQALAKDKDVVLEQDLSQHPVMLKADRQALQRVFVNVLSNAFKFSEPRHTIRITSDRHPETVTVKIIDQGPGLPQEEAARLFEKFYQAKSTSKLADGGTGLGLFISKQIIEHHGGKITVESTVKIGTTFIITLPIHSPKPASTPQ